MLFSLLLLSFSLLSLFFLFIFCCGVIFSLVDQKTSHSGLIPVKWLQFSVGRQIQLIIYGLLNLEKHSNTNPFGIFSLHSWVLDLSSFFFNFWSPLQTGHLILCNGAKNTPLNFYPNSLIIAYFLFLYKKIVIWTAQKWFSFSESWLNKCKKVWQNLTSNFREHLIM